MTKDYYYVAKCECGYGTVHCGDVPDVGEEEDCETCGQSYDYSEIHEVTDPSKIIVAAEAELEDANFHSIGRLPSELYEAISTLVPQAQHLELAWKIVNTMPS